MSSTHKYFNLQAAAQKIAAARGISVIDALRVIDQAANPGRTGTIDDGALGKAGGWSHSKQL